MMIIPEDKTVTFRYRKPYYRIHEQIINLAKHEK
jgi:hypothetical protein